MDRLQVMTKFYAVRKGRGGPAIYTDWKVCEYQVKDFKGATFKSFTTLADAEAYLRGENPTGANQGEKIVEGVTYTSPTVTAPYVQPGMDRFAHLKPTQIPDYSSPPSQSVYSPPPQPTYSLPPSSQVTYNSQLLQQLAYVQQQKMPMQQQVAYIPPVQQQKMPMQQQVAYTPPVQQQVTYVPLQQQITYTPPPQPTLPVQSPSVQQYIQRKNITVTITQSEEEILAAALKMIAAIPTSTIICYTDGACSGNPGPCGSGVYIQWPGRQFESVNSKFLGKGTNNYAEMYAIKMGLELVISMINQVATGAITNINLANTELYLLTDSKYVEGILVRGDNVRAHKELVTEIKTLIKSCKFTIRLTWIPAHKGIAGNVKADQLATSSIR